MSSHAFNEKEYVVGWLVRCVPYYSRRYGNATQRNGLEGLNFIKGEGQAGQRGAEIDLRHRTLVVVEQRREGKLIDMRVCVGCYRYAKMLI